MKSAVLGPMTVKKVALEWHSFVYKIDLKSLAYGMKIFFSCLPHKTTYTRLNVITGLKRNNDAFPPLHKPLSSYGETQRD